MRILLLAFFLTACAADEPDDPDDLVTDAEQEALSASCTEVRATVCHESPYDCSLPAARACDPLPRALDRVSHTAYFPIRGTGHVLEDSTGAVIATVTASKTKLNWGQRRTLHGTRKVMAFAVETDQGARSGWINESAIDRDLSFMPSVHDRDAGETSTWHLVVRDDNAYRDSLGDSLKVVADCGPGRNATDYLPRNGHVNLIFNLPGYQPALGSPTIDSYPVDAGLEFHRFTAQHSIARPLYSCRTGEPVKVTRTLSFLYGYVEADRPGWIAMPDVAPGT